MASLTPTPEMEAFREAARSNKFILVASSLQDESIRLLCARDEHKPFATLVFPSATRAQQFLKLLWTAPDKTMDEGEDALFQFGEVVGIPEGDLCNLWAWWIEPRMFRSGGVRFYVHVEFYASRLPEITKRLLSHL